MSRPGVDHKLCHYVDGQERQKTQEPLVAALGCFAVVAKKPTTVSGLLIELITYIEREMIGRKERGREAKREPNAQCSSCSYERSSRRT